MSNGLLVVCLAGSSWSASSSSCWVSRSRLSRSRCLARSSRSSLPCCRARRAPICNVLPPTMNNRPVTSPSRKIWVPVADTEPWKMSKFVVSEPPRMAPNVKITAARISTTATATIRPSNGFSAFRCACGSVWCGAYHHVQQTDGTRLVQRAVAVAALGTLYARRTAVQTAARLDDVARRPQPAQGSGVSSLGDAGATRVAFVDEDRWLTGIGVQGGRSPADVPAIARREQRQQPDRCVFGRMGRTGDVGELDFGRDQKILRHG